MTKDEALKLALNTFERMNHEDSIFAGEFDKEIIAIKAALAQPAQEPVAFSAEIVADVNGTLSTQWAMTPSEQLHLLASAYANKRIAMHKKVMKQQKQTPLDERLHNGTWIAHYEGYIAGYEAKEKSI